MPDLERVIKRQQLLADFGEFALRSQDLDKVLAEACRLVSEASPKRRTPSSRDGLTRFRKRTMPCSPPRIRSPT